MTVMFNVKGVIYSKELRNNYHLTLKVIFLVLHPTA